MLSRAQRRLIRQTIGSAPAPPPAPLERAGYSIAEAAQVVGVRPATLRRMVERYAQVEGDEVVSRLTGMTVRKRGGLGRWVVTLDPWLKGPA